MREITPILSAGGGQHISSDMGVPLLGSIPMDPAIAASGDSGRPYVSAYASSPTAKIMREIVRPLLALEPAAASATICKNRK